MKNLIYFVIVWAEEIELWTRNSSCQKVNVGETTSKNQFCLEKEAFSERNREV